LITLVLTVTQLKNRHDGYLFVYGCNHQSGWETCSFYRFPARKRTCWVQFCRFVANYWLSFNWFTALKTVKLYSSPFYKRMRRGNWSTPPMFQNVAVPWHDITHLLCHDRRTIHGCHTTAMPSATLINEQCSWNSR